ncbi:MAG: 4,5-dihydroxyphthalate dehydrogenase [Acidobacteria bacterium SCN 69-37]|nr:MAG: 4,5-dihydroxyphthalate dehydrogenase [Acidobacteria bacterium SCN 69-37]
MSTTGVTRREFVKTTGGAALGAIAMPAFQGGSTAVRQRRYAIVGTGVRAVGMWGRPVARGFQDAAQFVGLADINPLRLDAAKRLIGVDCPTFTSVDEMFDRARPDLLMVTTVDATHTEFIVKALDRGIDVATEKPMVIDETQCQAVLDAERRNGRQIVVTFNYRYAPKHQRVKELLMAGEIGTVTSVDFSWYLDTSHGADYFRRWHRLRNRSGSLWVHKATHHFDLINWWLDADPVTVTASAHLSNYGRNGPFRHTTCRGCPHSDQCDYRWDVTRDPELVALYVNAESADGYTRDGCVFKEDIDIFDTMNAVVTYSNGVTMSYSLNAFMPFEGFRLAFNGTKGRLEVRDYERQPWTVDSPTEIHLTRNFGRRAIIEVPEATGGHGGGDDILRNIVFRNASVPAHLALPGSRAGAMSCLTGIAARHSSDRGGTPVRIGELVKI